jgi:integrase/recombinase XerC/integrase/recombinase XerD
MDLVQGSNNELMSLDVVGNLISQFIASQDVKPSSKRLYQRTIKQYFNWVKKHNLGLKSINRSHIIAYKEELLHDGKSSLSVGSYLTVVRKFYEWTEANKYYPNVAKGIKTPKRKQAFRKQPLTPNQTSKLLDYFKAKADQVEGSRDYAIINLLLRTGLRTIEVITANIEDITFKQDKRVLLVQGKGEVEKNNFVILTEKAYEPIRHYLTLPHKGTTKTSQALFKSVSNNNLGQRLTTRTISKIAKEGLKAIGLDNRHLTAHSLRHTLAVTILRAGGSLADAQGVLRHANPATTQIYTRVIDEEIRIKNAPEELVDKLY